MASSCRWNPGRALTAADVVDVLGTPVVAEIPVGPAVARAIDAGLLLAQRSTTSPPSAAWPASSATTSAPPVPAT